jgi:hypothetical protein
LDELGWPRNRSKLDETVHYIAISGAAIWLVFTLSWATGRMASRVLALLERPRERAD